MFILIGIIYSFGFGLILDFGGLKDHSFFYIMSTVNVPFLVIQLIALLVDYIPESPNSLLANKKSEAAK